MRSMIRADFALLMPIIPQGQRRHKRSFASSRHGVPEVLQDVPPLRTRADLKRGGATFKGAGNAGYPMHPRPVCKGSKTVVTTVAPEHPAFPHTMVLTAYAALSPATNSFCHRRPRTTCAAKSGWTSQRIHELDTSNGCQDHAVLPYAAAPFVHTPDDRSQAALSGYLALRSPRATTLPRPPHLIPTLVTIAIRPLVGDETAGIER
jgi:hypothetical protein